MLKKVLLTIWLLLPSLFSVAQGDWTRDYKPFKIAGNLYYVGSYDLACYLITTPQGHILINTGTTGSDTMIRSHIEALGFKFSDIKTLLTTHAHVDHVGAMAAIKKATGAKMMINEKDAQVLEDGGKSDYVLGPEFRFEPVKADRLLHDKDLVTLGGMKLTVLHHPGHTKGATSFLFTVKDKQRSYRVLIANMPSILDDTKLPSMPKYPEVGKDYAYTLKVMKDLEFDLWLSSHASQFDMQKKHESGPAPEVFIDRKGYDESLKATQERYDKKLKEK